MYPYLFWTTTPNMFKIFILQVRGNRNDVSLKCFVNNFFAHAWGLRTGSETSSFYEALNINKLYNFNGIIITCHYNTVYNCLWVENSIWNIGSKL